MNAGAGLNNATAERGRFSACEQFHLDSFTRNVAAE